MKRTGWKTALALLVLALLCVGCGKTEEAPQPSPAREAREIIEELVVDYGSYGSQANAHVEALLRELAAVDARQAEQWQRIMQLWQSEVAVNYDALPEGLSDTDELALVVLGFQLNPDGTMREELIERLTVALHCAAQYPKAWIVCTGGGTAFEDENATEAGRMADWLLEQGVAPERLLVEDRSLTTAQNAVYSLALLQEKAPQVKQLAIISSDYHIATGALLFGAEAILRDVPLAVVSNAAWKAPSGVLSPMFQAGALLELSGDRDTAFAIYYDNYDIHELPPLD